MDALPWWQERLYLEGLNREFSDEDEDHASADPLMDFGRSVGHGHASPDGPRDDFGLFSPALRREPRTYEEEVAGLAAFGIRVTQAG